MAECPGGRTGRGTRSQFRLGIPGPGGFLRGSYPIRLGDIMDAGQSSQTGILSPSDLISPNKGTRTRTVREYEQTISELKKENFDLKLRVFLFEEAMSKHSRKDKDCSSPDKDNTVEVIVQMKLETESLRTELSHKEKLLQDTLNRAEKWETECKELEKKYAELHHELASLSELPSKQEFMLLCDEKENLLKENLSFKRDLLEKNEEIDVLNQKLEIFSKQNNILEEKIKKRSLAIQGFVYKNFKEKEMLPDELRNVVISAAQAAKNRNKEDLAIAVKSFSAALSQIMASPHKTSLSESEEKENIGGSQAKCLKEEFLEKSSMFLPSQSESCTELNRIQNLKEVLAERNSPVSQQLSNFDCVFQDSYMRGKILNENSVNATEKDVIDFINSSFPFCAAENESTVSYSNMPSSQQCSFTEHNLINLKDIVSPTEPSDLKQQGKTRLKDSAVSHTSSSKEHIKLLKENEQLKLKIEENCAVICDLRATCQELELRKVQLEELQNAVSKASECYHSYVQTDIGGNDLIQLYETAKMKKDATLSDNIDELREDILMLLLAIEGKNKELTDVKETLSAVQADLKNVMNSSRSAVDKDYMNERNELHERLAFSCSVNVELMKHLRNLEAFMEDLLQHKFDSSMESINERSDFLSNVSRCLNESLKLSNALSDHLSICEGSKLFEACESFLGKSASYSDEKSLPHLDVSEFNVPEYHSASNQGIRVSEEYFPYVCKDNVQRIGKEALDSLLMDGGLLCIRCSHQVNYPLNMSEISHPTRNSTNHTSKTMGYLSSDSDIWSEPDRDVSMQRIGINLQYSPVTSKSPRKQRSKEKRISNRLSPDHNTSSSEVQHCPKQRRNGTACRRLFVKESVKNQDFTLEKYYFILAEKFSRLQSLLNGLENVKDREISDEICNKLNGVMTSLGEALQKLQNAKEHSKNCNPVCGRCVMLDLLMDLKTFHNEVDIHIVSSRRQAEILQQFWKEIHLLKEDCEEPFSLFSTKTDKISKSTQSDPLPENNQIKINKLEQTIVDLNNKNKNLMENLNEVNSTLMKEQNVLESVKTENLMLSNHVNHLKDELSDMKHKESELTMKNTELVEKLGNVKKNNSELNSILKDLEQKRNESNIVLDTLTAELQKNKLDLENMNTKCIQYEQELSEQIKLKETYEENFKNLETASCNEKESFLNQIKNVISEKDSYAKGLLSMQEKMQALEKENSSLNNNLNASHSEMCSLQEIVEKHKNTNENLNTICTELQTELKNTMDLLLNMKEQYNLYKKETAIKLKSGDEYHRQLKKLEAKSLSEEKKLGNEISRLTAERDDIFQKLKDEQKNSEKLMLEKTELNRKLFESCQQISNLQQSNEKLENTHINLLHENELSQNALLSSNSKCDALSNDLRHIRETLQNLECRCASYEKELVASAGMKDNLVECLLNINHEFSTNRQKLNEICKAYNHRSSMDLDDTYISDFIPAIDEDHVKNLCENVDSESKKLLKSVDTLLEIMKNCQLKSQEIKSAEEKYHMKDANLKKQIEFLGFEIQHLKSQKDHLERVIGEQQKSLIESQKSVRFSSFEIQNLKGKLQEAENEIEKGRILLKIKEDEITMLQESVFNLRTDIHQIKGETADLLNKRSSLQEFFEKADSAHLDNSLPSQFVTEVTFQPATQAKDTEEHSLSTDESAASVNASEMVKSTCCEKYLKKYHSLQTKLALYKKRIEILETEKNRLRESLNRFQNSRSSPSTMEDQEPESKKSLDLESELERKKAFISELKSELLKTCNALISKEEEIEKLTAKLSECETKSKSPTFEMMEDCSRVDTKTVDSHVKNLKSYKWKLIQMIFEIQREFYEKRGIHLNYFDKFKDHVNNLYSLHLTHPLAKSESLPLLDSHSMRQRQTDDRFKNLVGLELDIECLENLKIFLNRFFVPCMFETSHIADSESKKSPYSLRERKHSITEKQIVELGVESTEKLKKAEFLDTLCCRYLSDFVPFYKKDFSENSYSFETFAMNVSNHLDFIENFFKAVNECKGLDRFEFSSKDFEDKADAKSLLQKMVKEINILYAGGEKLFSLNGVLKHLDLFTLPLPKTASKQDMSDRESVLSEETITISQSESPVSFEEICPIKLPYSETLKLEENLISSQPSELVGTVTDPQSVKMTAIGSSCDSVCHRSHYSSPDLGIESDPNHESSVPEQKEDGISKYQKLILEEQKFIVKPQPKTSFTSTESAGRWKGTNFAGDTLYSIGNLPHYELLKREIQESLVGIKSVLSRTGDGLHHIAKYTSPRKTLEYSTLKAIKDTCGNIEVCLKEAYKLVGKFWIASCPSEQEWNSLLEENQTLYQQLTKLKNMMQQQENEFKKAMGKLEHAQLLKANMEKKISKKLVKTKKVIRQAELKLLENKCQNFPPVPKYPLEQSATNLPQDL